MTELGCKLLVIGAGPGGYVCAIRAGQLGIDTIVVEGLRVGGTCLNVGCIPSKALIHVADEFERLASASAGASPFGLSVQGAPTLDFAKAIGWKDTLVARLQGGVAALLRRARVRIVEGHARFQDGRTVVVETQTGQTLIRAETVVIATGSRPVEVPNLPFGGKVLSSSEALSLTERPRRLAVVGAGYIGLELGMAFAKLGSEVTVVEAQDRILPNWDRELTAPVASRLAALGMRTHLGAKARGLTASGLLVETADGGERAVAADRVLVTAGRQPNLDRLGLENLVIDMDGRFVAVDERCATSMRGIHAIGDVTGEPMLAHRAMAQGEMVAEIVAGRRRAFDKRCIPAVCFTDPEIVSAGLSPPEARGAGHDVTVGQFPFSASGRAMTMGSEEGFVRVVARRSDHLVLGIQAVGRGIAELSSAFALAIEMGATLEDVAATVQAHPTLGEALQEAASKALGHAIHV